MKRTIHLLMGLGLVAVVILGSGYVGWARWEECRRVHPFWYCALLD